MARVLPAEGVWAGRLAWLGLALSVGAVLAALIGAVGSGQEAWHFRVGFAFLRYSFFAAIAGGLLAVASILLMRDRPGPRRLWAILLALLFGFGFAAYLGNQYVKARSLPAIHDVSTDLEDLPEFRALQVRADNLENVPDEGRPALAAMEPEERWKALHREAYGDLKPISVPWSVRETIGRAQTVAEKKGWQIVHFDPARGTLEATDTTTFFRFKDDVVIRARPDPEKKGRTLVDMRSISRIGGSDVGTNARRVREYLKDLRQS
jgi:uncharacterized protein (DUF1499 family)